MQHRCVTRLRFHTTEVIFLCSESIIIRHVFLPLSEQDNNCFWAHVFLLLSHVTCLSPLHEGWSKTKEAVLQD